MNRFLPLAVSTTLLLLVSCASLPAAEKPNILCIVAEDINPHLGCYGDAYARTPNLDRFAAQAARYLNCWSTAPVCAPARTALITGVYPTTTGSEHMRSLVRMPPSMRMYPQILRQAGYYCVNRSKEDYNLAKPGQVWDESSNRAHWKNRKPGQPFFAAFNIEATHESQIRKRPHRLEHEPAEARLPAYHPDTPEVRRDWAQYYDNLTTMDGIVAGHLAELEEAGLSDNTIVFFFGDNGSGMPRSKRWPQNSGLHVPLIVRVPDKLKPLAPEGYRPGAAIKRLVGFVDFAPTFLSLAGVRPPDWMQGAAFMGMFPGPAPTCTFGLRGRMDERMDLVRSVRNERYVYIRNYMPHLIYGQHLAYMFETPTTRVWKELYDQGKLRPPQTHFWEPKPPEELYDLESDPDETRNLVGSPVHRETRNALRRELTGHLLRTRDAGFIPESELHRLAGGTSPFEVAQDPQAYPVERVLSVAEAAASGQADVLPALREMLASGHNSTVQYWAALGILIRGSNAVAATRQELRQALTNSSPSVRIAAAQSLGRHGSADDLAQALPVLGELASPARHGVYVAAESLAAIEALGERAKPLLPELKKIQKEDFSAPDRVRAYIPRLLESVLREAPVSSKPESP